ncbi:hypothetical protein ACIQRS_09555 [Streptomyces termitum]|uniref:Uncharacterized protein n=1 Tax=Streptomyces termitum TaxID=67368 RepID=A0A918W499_9ACTN|nr:hypothetical protein [Streptomyces termitum]GHA63084.1 hypothetical protein GCM10010305_00420 [Streptomyces termitum]
MSDDQRYGPGGGQPHDPHAHAYDPPVAQTWEGQTWDTTYQPAVDPHAPRPYGQDQGRAQQYGQSQGYGQGQGQGYGQGYGYGQDAQARPSYGGQGAYAPQGHPGQAYAPEAYPQAPAQAPAQGAPRAYAEPLPAPQAPAPAFAAAQAPAPAHAPVQEQAPAPAPAGDGPAYSSPTTSGATRITDAQRARAEGRSPIIDPGLRPAVLTAVLGLLLAGGAALGPYGLLLPLVALQGLTAAGWFRLNGMWPARQGIALAFLGGLVSDAALLAVGREHAAGAILGTLGVWVLLCLVLQLRSHADPDERVYGLMATIASAALTVLATGHLGAEADAVVIGGAAVAATVLARAVPLPGPVSLAAALLAGAGAGLVAGALTATSGAGALLGLGAGVCALVGLRAAAYDYPSRFVHMTAGVALPLTAAAPAVYLLGRALV